MDQIHGYIEKISFQNPENGYTIAQLQEPNRRELTCIVGSMPSIQAGETVRCLGEWKQHLIYGRQFIVKECRSEAPADIEGMKKYLGSGLIRGIGPTYAARIVDVFGIETLHVIDEAPHRLLEVPGLGKKRKEKIQACWEEQKSIRDVMIFLQTYGVSPAYAQKIFRFYGEASIQKVKENPYRLSQDIYGIGFKTADAIAQKMGITKEAPERIRAGIEHVLAELSSDGHVCFPLKDFFVEASQVLEIDSLLIEKQIESLLDAERIEVFDLMQHGLPHPFIWIKPLFISEVGISREFQRLRQNTSNLREVDTAKALEWVQQKLNIELATNQQEAVTIALQAKLMIITGGPGTGKSTITNAILTITSKLSDHIILAAPTGRAAKRMSEITGRKASTIHSLLEFDFKAGGFKKNRKNPLEGDLFIIDESSMIDTLLMYNLLKAMPAHARLIFVGDINQLPSVGPGNVLQDIIHSGCVPVITLNQIFRQAAGSRIITNAHRINEGLYPDTRNLSDSDFYFLESEDPEKVLADIVSLVSLRLPQKYGFHPLNDIQVLAPMKRGVIGTQNLNVVLQDALNPSKNNALYRTGQRFQEGDKVMQLRNDYKREVFNGDIGIIKEIHAVDQQVIVEIDNRDVIYEYSDLDELVLAYAVSVHKSQGSEFPCIIIPVHTTHFKLLNRNLLYTAVTRGKKLVILVGTSKALFLAVKNDEVKKRYTGLQQALVGINLGI